MAPKRAGGLISKVKEILCDSDGATLVKVAAAAIAVTMKFMMSHLLTL
jgi:hypothetical protein